MLGAKFFYGGFESLYGEIAPVSVRRVPRVHNHMIRYATEFEIHLQGSICINGSDPVSKNDPALVASRISQIDAAFTLDYQDWGFIVYDSNNNPIKVHEVKTNDPFNLSGNRLKRFAWRADAGPVELVNTRSFDIVLGATFESVYSNKIFGQQQLEYYGTGGPKYEWTKLFTGTWVRREVEASTFQVIMQSGEIHYWLPGGPLPTPITSLATFEDEEQRYISKLTPTFFGNYPNPQYRLFKRSYRFVYKLPPNYAVDPEVFL